MCGVKILMYLLNKISGAEREYFFGVYRKEMFFEGFMKIDLGGIELVPAHHTTSIQLHFITFYFILLYFILFYFILYHFALFYISYNIILFILFLLYLIFTTLYLIFSNTTLYPSNYTLSKIKLRQNCCKQFCLNIINHQSI